MTLFVPAITSKWPPGVAAIHCSSTMRCIDGLYYNTELFFKALDRRHNFSRPLGHYCLYISVNGMDVF